MQLANRRADSNFLKFAAPYIDVTALGGMIAYVLWLLPYSLVSQGPATGGDMGSHFWPLQALMEYGIPEGRLRMWNPGNLAGEPYFLQYFPLPYFVMAALALVMPLGAAFSVGTILPVIAFPLSVYLALRILRLPFPAPLLGVAFSEIFLFNESYSMWGGNSLSTLSGQFAHGYALNLFIIALALFAREFAARRLPVRGIVTSVAIGLSHAYVFLGVPFLLLTPLVSSRRNWKLRACHAVVAGSFIILLLLWFIVPMLGNTPWTTDFAYRWGSGQILSEAFPRHFLLFFAAGLCSAIALLTRRGQSRTLAIGVSFLFAVPALGFVVLYFAFPYLSLIDIRALPQVSLLALILSGALCGLAIRQFFLRTAVFLAITSVAVSLWCVDLHVQQFPVWADWNYSGWRTKPLSEPLEKLSAELKGNFSEGRVAYEHNTANQAAGTERVFEMLPYFANRATMESVYHYASLLSPAAFHLQAEISATPSCPFSQYECPKRNFTRAVEHARLVGVEQFILVSDETKNMARAAAGMKEGKSFGPWTIFTLIEKPAMVEVPSTTLYPASHRYWNGRFDVRERVSGKKEIKPVEVSPSDWKERFYQWFLDFRPDSAFMFYSPNGENTQPLSGTSRNCTASVDVRFNRLTLHTSCPGFPHILKFSYHGDWVTDTGDSLFAVSPGFIGLIPSSTEVKLTFGGTVAWQISSLISLISAAGFFFIARRKL